jgi:hypothetical protein
VQILNKNVDVYIHKAVVIEKEKRENMKNPGFAEQQFFERLETENSARHYLLVISYHRLGTA